MDDTVEKVVLTEHQQNNQRHVNVMRITIRWVVEDSQNWNDKLSNKNDKL